MRPVRAKALKYTYKNGKSIAICKAFAYSFKAFALTGRQVCDTKNNPGRCPGLGASALSGRAAYMGFLAFGACCLYELLITQHAYSF